MAAPLIRAQRSPSRYDTPSSVWMRNEMPKYEYDCPNCGSFSDFRPMAEYELPITCPSCGVDSPRALLNFPAMSTRTVAARHGDPARANRFSTTSGHGSGCRCCGGNNFKIPRAEWTSKLL